MITCTCGVEFFPAYRGQEHCSATCRKDATKKPPKDTRRPPGFEDPQRTCRYPGCTKRAVHQHHVVTRNHVEEYGGDIADPDNAFGLCEFHHMQHHKARRRIKISELRPENLEFARRLLGDYVIDYLPRYYDAIP